MKTLLPSISFLTLLLPTPLLGQQAESTLMVESSEASQSGSLMSDSSVNLNAPIHFTPHNHEGAYKAEGSHMVSTRHIPNYISPDQLLVGKTYNRDGDLVSPTGYGVQVISFRKTKNLCKYLHLYHKKEMYIQVVTVNSTKVYRVILGADQNKHSIEHEIQLFQRAGLQAVLRKHK